jgi:hypothetical protein
MAKATNPFGISGNVGDINIYRHPRQGWLVRKRRESNAEAIANDPNFAKVREQNKVFGTASTYGRILRHSLSPILSAAADNELPSRLTRIFTHVIRAAENEKTKINRQFHLLNGIDLNEEAKKIHLQITGSSYSKEKGIGIRTSLQLKRLTHTAPMYCRVFALLRRVDIANNKCEKATTVRSGYTSIEAGDIKNFSFNFDQGMRGGNLFLVLSVHFYEQVNRKMYLLGDKGLTGGRLYWLG